MHITEKESQHAITLHCTRVRTGASVRMLRAPRSQFLGQVFTDLFVVWRLVFRVSILYLRLHSIMIIVPSSKQLEGPQTPSSLVIADAKGGEVRGKVGGSKTIPGLAHDVTTSQSSTAWDPTTKIFTPQHRLGKIPHKIRVNRPDQLNSSRKPSIAKIATPHSAWWGTA